MTSTVERFDIGRQAAEIYESRFVPAMFGEWAPHLVEAAGIGPGQAVLDVGCGTGIVARTAAEQVGAKGRVIGLDLNPHMLAVARRLRPDIDWREGDAMGLPFEPASFDATLSQAMLMFVPDPATALAEMRRVTKPSGVVAAQVWDRLEAQPGYRPFFEVIGRHAGGDAVRLIGAYWLLGDLAGLRGLFAAAGLRVADVVTRLGTARFDSADEVVRIEVESTPLRQRISDAVYERILADSREVLAAFATNAGRIELPIQGHIVTARPV